MYPQVRSAWADGLVNAITPTLTATEVSTMPTLRTIFMSLSFEVGALGQAADL